MIGLQLGAGCTYETSRWSIGINGIGGAYANDASAHSQLNFTVDDDDDFDYSLSEDELSFIAESSLIAKWHLMPNFSLRAGLHLFYVTAVAQAPHQLNFIGVPTRLVTSGDPYYQGVSLGFEGYW
jgi:hypothetical protein